MMKYILILFFSISCFAQDEAAESKTATDSIDPPKKPRITSVKSHMVGVSFHLWKEEVQLKTDEVAFPLETQMFGSSIFYQFSKRSIDWRYYIGTGAGIGSSHINNSTTDINYNQSYVSFFFAHLNPGINHFFSKDSEIGLSAPVYFRTVDWKDPTSTAKVSNKTAVLYGVQLNLTLRLTNTLSFIQSIATLPNANAKTIWSGGLTWRL